MQPNYNKYSDGLVPAIIQDAETKNVLMLGFMNEAAFEKTKAINMVTFFSRTKNRLWTKGEESGNFLTVVSIDIDCDNDTLLIKANPTGAVCHTGSATCFDDKNVDANFIYTLEKIIEQRKIAATNTSYIKSLFDKGINKIAQKVGEEATELIIEAKDDNAELFKNEAADLLFHYLILLNAKGFKLNDIIDILEKRH